MSTVVYMCEYVCVYCMVYLLARQTLPYAGQHRAATTAGAAVRLNACLIFRSSRALQPIMRRYQFNSLNFYAFYYDFWLMITGFDFSALPIFRCVRARSICEHKTKKKHQNKKGNKNQFATKFPPRLMGCCAVLRCNKRQYIFCFCCCYCYGSGQS